MAYSVESSIVLPVTAIVIVSLIAISLNSFFCFLKVSSEAVECLIDDRIRSTGAKEANTVVLIETIEIVVDVIQ